jgi:Tol biopolymer transport system component
MSFPYFTHSVRHLRRALFPRLLWFAVPLAAGCDSAREPVGPTAESETVTDAPSEASSPTTQYLVTGDRIAFVSSRTGSPDVYKMDPQGGSLVSLTPNATAQDETPAWSWDNLRLAMVRQRPYGSGTTKDIYVVNRDGSNGHWVRPTAFPFQLGDPAWQPGGSRIVLSVWLYDGLYLATMNTTTGDVSLLGGGSGKRGSNPSYDPTGQRIIYVLNASDKNSILQVNADGSGQKVLVSSTQTFDSPSFSPDGKKIVYSRYAANTTNGYTTYSPDIFVKNLVDGTTKRIVASAAYDTEPTWSPDGTKVAFVSKRSGKPQIYTVSASGGGLTRITQTSTAETSPAWTH